MVMGTTAGFPFTAIVGCEAAKRALLLLAVDPSLKGVLIGAGPGSAKSTLARAFVVISDRHKPLVTLPPNVTEENLLGGLDIEKTLAACKRVYTPGLLARADGRVLFIEDINLLDGKISSHIAAALDTGQIKVERDGVGGAYPTDFILIGTYNTADAPPGSALHDRVGMIVESSQSLSTDERAEIITRSLQFDNNPREFEQEHAIAEAELKVEIELARINLPKIGMTREQISNLAQVALSFDIEGSRADIFAVKAARANAALSGRDKVDEEDLIVAIQLVLMPRAATPFNAEQDARPDLSSDSDKSENARRDSVESDEQSASSIAPIEDLIIKAIDASVPGFLFEQMRFARRDSKPGKRGTPLPAVSGRAITSGSERRLSKVAMFPTLCAAAPFQVMRPKQTRPIVIKKCDIRYKRFKNNSGILFIFAVDASGSMAFNRLAQAKGALARILQQAYLYRDKVALISFRGEKADVLLPPTRSMERAKSLIDSLPAGGGTPIAAALVRALELAKYARIRKMSQVMVVLMTDGRANISSRNSSNADPTDPEAINEELRHLGRILRIEAIESVVIDTKPRFVSTGEARNLADMLGGKYLYLPRAGATGIHKAIESIASDIRAKSAAF